jgi:hypothetical protein
MRLLVLPYGASDQPEHGRPQTDEERAALRVPAFVLVNRSGTNPQADAQEDGQQADQLQVILPQTNVMKRPRKHGSSVPGVAVD